ncbi:hypothetical protein, partial [Pseudanabaena sp. SR411]|uniref:hypothetical protein n=1 Tax=Pseudanabaena sp. SR411 TaxID=1980935 RepID=UPI001C3D62A1
TACSEALRFGSFFYCLFISYFTMPYSGKGVESEQTRNLELTKPSITFPSTILVKYPSNPL